MSLPSSLAVVGLSTVMAIVAGTFAARHAALAAPPAAPVSAAPGAGTTVVQIVAPPATTVAGDERAPATTAAPVGSGNPTQPAPAPAAPEPPTPEAARAVMRDRITASPPSSARWTGNAAAAFDSWSRAHDDVRLGKLDCFEQGCIARATYRDPAAFDALSASFVESAGFATWPSSKWRSPPVTTASGEVEADWVLFPPEGE